MGPITFKGSHWVLLGLSFVALAIPWVLTEAAAGQVTLTTGVVSALANVLTVVKLLIGYLSPSTSDKVNVKAGVAAEKKGSVPMFPDGGPVKQIAAFFLGAVVAVAFACSVSGCISAVPIEPVTPANSTQVSGCQSIASTHNDLVIGGFVFSGGATVLGAVDAVETGANVRTDLAISAAIVAALAGVDAAWMAQTSSEFANGQCSTVVGPLGATPLGARK